MQQIAQDIRNSLTYSQLLDRVQQWNLQFRLREKYHSWLLKYPLPKVTANFYKLVQHSLTTYILKNFSWLLSDFQVQKISYHLREMKIAYSHMNMGRSISSQTFNFSMILLVKLTAYFLSNHITVILVDLTLQCDIYRQSMLNILGIEIEKNTYRILLKMFKSKKEMVKERESINFQKEDKENSLESFSKIKTIQSIGRRNGKHETTFFNHITNLNEERAKLEEIKFLLKSNLYVKPIIKKPEPKYTITEIKQRQQESLIKREFSSITCDLKASHAKNRSMQTPTGKFTIQSNQLSNAFSSNYSLKLNEIKNYSIHCSHNKKISRYQPKRKESKKLEIKREESSQEDKKGVKPAKNWVKIVTEMKDELYQNSKESRMSEEQSQQTKKEKRYYDFQPYAAECKKVANPDNCQVQNSNEQIFKFRKLDLMNSPNIITYDDYSLEDEPTNKSQYLKSHDGYQIKMNRSRLKRCESKKKKEVAVHLPVAESHKEQ